MRRRLRINAGRRPVQCQFPFLKRRVNRITWVEIGSQPLRGASLRELGVDDAAFPVYLYDVRKYGVNGLSRAGLFMEDA